MISLHNAGNIIAEKNIEHAMETDKLYLKCDSND